MNRQSSSPSTSINRRRCLGILASCAALPHLGALSALAKPGEALKKVTWSGRALGSHASITLYTDDEVRARKVLVEMLGEIKRLETYFSLFLERSLLNELNASGVLNNPPREFYQLLQAALQISEQSEGRFDPTVQPLFMAFKDCARDRQAHAFGRPLEIDERVVRARGLVGWRHVICTPSSISFGQASMGITLNGIAQGFITDRALDILKSAGFTQTLVNFGEYGAGATKPGKNGWRIQLGKSAEGERERPLWTLRNCALAASQKLGYVFDHALDLHHMLDPKSGTSARHWREIYVEAPNATLADGASTALFATAPSEVAELGRKLKITRALLIDRDGRLTKI